MVATTTREASRDVSVKQEEIDELTERVERVSSIEIVSQKEIEELKERIAKRSSTESSEEGAPLKNLWEAGVGGTGEFGRSSRVKGGYSDHVVLSKILMMRASCVPVRAGSARAVCVRMMIRQGCCTSR
jgi:hypothetical protein